MGCSQTLLLWSKLLFHAKGYTSTEVAPEPTLLAVCNRAIPALPEQVFSI
jgi:hypothetical protein